MGAVGRSQASLRIAGDDLVPVEVTEVLGAEPSWSHRKGDPVRANAIAGPVRRTGMWSLQATPQEPEDLNVQVTEILSQLTNDLPRWHQLADRFAIDLFCGLFLNEPNEGLSLSSNTMIALAERHIELGLDIYGPTPYLKLEEPCPCGSGKHYGECCAQRVQS